MRGTFDFNTEEYPYAVQPAINQHGQDCLRLVSYHHEDGGYKVLDTKLKTAENRSELTLRALQLKRDLINRRPTVDGVTVR